MEEEKVEEEKVVDTRSHYAKYKGAHKKYEKSEKGQIARKRYMTSEKGVAARKRYMKKRYEEQKAILKAAREAGIDGRTDR